MSTNKLLRQYYKMDSSGTASSSNDIDSPYFDHAKFFEEKTKNDPVTNLLTLQSSVVTEIRSFENDLQTLVCDNYTKFLSASNTVNQLSEDIASIKSNISDLKVRLRNLRECNSDMNEKLNPGRDKLSRLVSISRLLKRVKFISKLPEKLREYREQELYSEAVDVWSKYEAILLSQQHFPSFSRIHTECTGIIEDVKSRIRGHMLNTDVSVLESIEYGTLLIKMQTSVGLICSQLAHHRFLVIDNILEYEDIPTEPFSCLDFLSKIIVNDSLIFIKQYEERLVPLEKPENIQKIEGVLSDFKKNTFTRIAQFLPLDPLFSLQPEDLVQYVNVFINTMQCFSVNGNINIYTTSILESYTTNRLNNIILEITNTDDVPKDGFNSVFEKFIVSVNDVISNYEVFINSGYLKSSDFIVKSVCELFTKLFSFIKGGSPERSLNFGVILQSFAQRDFYKLFGVFGRFNTNQSIQENLISTSKQVSFECLWNYITHKRSSIENELFSRYVEGNFLSYRNDNKASDAAQYLFEYIDSVRSEVHEVLDVVKEETNEEQSWSVPKYSYKTSLFGTKGPSFTGARDGGLQIDRMFTTVNRLHLSKDVTFNEKQILNSLIMYALKTILEIVRSSYLTKKSFNQVQIDLYFIYNKYKSIAKETELFEALVDEVIQSAADRCENPEPIDTSTLASIYEKCEK